MRIFLSLPVWMKLLAAIAMTFSVGIAASAELTCEDLFGKLASAPAVVRTNSLLAAPLETAYTSYDGKNRYFRDGTIWELHNNVWVEIGRGRFSDGLIYEDTIRNLLLPDLRPVRDFKYGLSNFEGDRYYPNVGYSYPSQIHRLEIGSGPTHFIEIIIPKGSGWEYAAAGIIRTIVELPWKRIESLSTVRLNVHDNHDDPYWQKKYINFSKSAATAANGNIDLYGVTLRNFADANSEAVRVTRHEFGHLIASKIFGSTDPSTQYTSKASKDTNSVSEYGNNSWAEDFAEGIEMYLRTNAASLDPQLRRQLANRFAFFDDVFSYRTPQSLDDATPLTKRMRLEIFVKIVDSNTIVAIAPEINRGIVLKLN